MKAHLLVIAAFALLSPVSLSGAPKLVEGHEKVRPGDGDPYEARAERGEAIMVLRVFFNREGHVRKIVPLGFRGHRSLLDTAVSYATQMWSVRMERPRPIYWEIPIIYSIPGPDSWTAPISRAQEGLTTERRCADLLRIIRTRAGK